MSVDGTLRALEWRAGSQLHRHVLLVIGGTQERDSNWSQTSLDSLAELTGYARSTVAAAVRHLLEAGVLERRGTRGRNVNEYRVVRAAQPSGNSPATSDGSTVRQPSGNRPATVRRQRSDQEERHRVGDRGKGIGKTTPPSPPSQLEVIQPEVLPAPAPNGARGELAEGLQLDELIAEVRARRQPTLTRRQAVDARRLGRDALEAGWPPRLVVAALVATKAFTRPAFDFAVGQLRQEVVADERASLTKFQRSRLR